MEPLQGPLRSHSQCAWVTRWSPRAERQRDLHTCTRQCGSPAWLRRAASHPWGGGGVRVVDLRVRAPFIWASLNSHLPPSCPPTRPLSPPEVPWLDKNGPCPHIPSHGRRLWLQSPRPYHGDDDVTRGSVASTREFNELIYTMPLPRSRPFTRACNDHYYC